MNNITAVSRDKQLNKGLGRRDSSQIAPFKNDNGGIIPTLSNFGGPGNRDESNETNMNESPDKQHYENQDPNS